MWCRARPAKPCATPCEAAPDPAAHGPDYPYDGAYRERQHDAAAQLHGTLGKTACARSFLRNFEFFGAPHAAFVFLPERFGLREAVDCGMYGQTLMLAMVAHGVASCPQTSLSFYPRIVRDALGWDGRSACCSASRLATKTPTRKPTPAGSAVPAWTTR